MEQILLKHGIQVLTAPLVPAHLERPTGLDGLQKLGQGGDRHPRAGLGPLLEVLVDCHSRRLGGDHVARDEREAEGSFAFQGHAHIWDVSHKNGALEAVQESQGLIHALHSILCGTTAPSVGEPEQEVHGDHERGPVQERSIDLVCTDCLGGSEEHVAAQVEAVLPFPLDQTLQDIAQLDLCFQVRLQPIARGNAGTYHGHLGKESLGASSLLGGFGFSLQAGGLQPTGQQQACQQQAE